MRRRKFIALLGGAAAIGWPRDAGAQQREKPARLGYVWIGGKNSERSTLTGMREGLQQLGYSEGGDFVIEERYAELDPARLPDILAELIRSKVDLILSPGNAVTRAAMQATSRIPIIATAPDLLASGFVANLARPGGNVTGISLTAGAELSQKWLELLKEAFPKVVTVAVLTNLHLASAAYLEQIRVASSALGIQPTHFQARDLEELERALAAIAAMQPDGFVIESDPGLISNRSKIIAFAAGHRLPTVYGNLDYIADGGLMGYFTSIEDTWRRLGTYVDKVLKGARPADLPVEQPTRFELIINLRTAKALGLVVPPSLLARANAVIE